MINIRCNKHHQEKENQAKNVQVHFLFHFEKVTMKLNILFEKLL